MTALGVVHAGLQVGRSVGRNGIGKAGTVAIEEDQSREGGEAHQEALVTRLLPDDFQMGHPRGHVHKVDGTATHDLPRDVGAVTGLGVLDLGGRHAGILARARARPQPKTYFRPQSGLTS